MAREHFVHLRHLNLAVQNLAEPALAAHGISLAQLEVLFLVWGHDGIDQRELVRLLGISRASLHSLISGLERKLLVRRTRHPVDGRAFVVHETERGAALRPALYREYARLDGILLRNFTAPERARFIELMDKALRNIEQHRARLL